MDKDLRPYVAELIGTFALVFLSAGAVCANYLTFGRSEQAVLSLPGIALAAGLALAVALTATMNVSGGYLNPAVTLMLYVFKKIDGIKASWLIGVQLLGAALAGLFLKALFHDELYRYGVPHVNLPAFNTPILTAGVMMSGGGIELVLTFILVFAIFGTVFDPRAPKLGGVLVGLALAAVVLMGYNLTGGSANPARCFGTYLWETSSQQGHFREHVFVYWLGPMVGALLAGGVYTWLILPVPEEEKKHAAPAAVPAGVSAGAGLAKAKK